MTAGSGGGGGSSTGSGGSPFAARVGGVLGTRVAQFAANLITVGIIAAILGPGGRGAYATAILFPQMLFAVGQLGLPASMTFFSGRGRPPRDLVRIGAFAGGFVAASLIGLAWLALPFLETNLLAEAHDQDLRIALILLPIQLTTAIGQGLLFGRLRTRRYNISQITVSASALLLVLILVVGLGLGVTGAVIAFVTASGLGALIVITEVIRLVASSDQGSGEPSPASASASASVSASIGLVEYVRHGLALYLPNVTSFFSYRADVFLLNAFLAGVAGGSAEIGLYTFAVTIAEMTFYVPDSVSSILYPSVARQSREDADRTTPSISRLTMLLTFGAALVIVPVAIVAILVVPRLQAYTGSFAPLLVIMPGILALSLSKVLASYISGLGRTRPVTVAAVVALATNLAVNILLIPRIGIVGAAAASLISYSIHASMLVTIASRMTGTGISGFLIPTGLEVQRIRSGAAAVRGRIGRRA